MNESISTPDHNVTRDNPQTETAATPQQMTMEQAIEHFFATATHEEIEALLKKARFDEWQNMPIPAPAAANEAEINRTPRTDRELAWVGNDAPSTLVSAMRKLELANNALRARVALQEANIEYRDDIIETLRAQLKEATERAEKAEESDRESLAMYRNCRERADALQRECDRLHGRFGLFAAKWWLLSDNLPTDETFNQIEEQLSETANKYLLLMGERDTARAELAKFRGECDSLKERFEAAHVCMERDEKRIEKYASELAKWREAAEKLAGVLNLVLPNKLHLAADWIDFCDKKMNETNHEMQDDLRTMAREGIAALERYRTLTEATGATGREGGAK